MRQKRSKKYKQQAEDWCYDFLMESFPEEVVQETSRESLWNLAFPETHYKQVLRHTWSTDVEDGDTYERFRLFKMSPRWLYKQIKKNPLVTKQELTEMES
ncbi:MAG: hypothetical protein V3S69_00235 [Dehalococcoidales bacterium]